MALKDTITRFLSGAKKSGMESANDRLNAALDDLMAVPETRALLMYAYGVGVKFYPLAPETARWVRGLAVHNDASNDHAVYIKPSLSAKQMRSILIHELRHVYQHTQLGMIESRNGESALSQNPEIYMAVMRLKERDAYAYQKVMDEKFRRAEKKAEQGRLPGKTAKETRLHFLSEITPPTSAEMSKAFDRMANNFFLHANYDGRNVRQWFDAFVDKWVPDVKGRIQNLNVFEAEHTSSRVLPVMHALLRPSMKEGPAGQSYHPAKTMEAFQEDLLRGVSWEARGAMKLMTDFQKAATRQNPPPAQEMQSMQRKIVKQVSRYSADLKG